LGYAHLWYVPALIIVLAILYLFRKLIDRKILCITIATVLFIAGYCLQQYVNSLRLEPSLFVISISRNALFFALPFVLFGVLIRKWVSKTLPIKPNVLFSATLIFSLFLLVEIGINIYSTRFQQQDIYLSLLALCPLLFLCVLQKGKVEKGDDYIARLGNAIYFTHFMVMVFLHGLFPSHSEVILLPVQIFITLLLSIGVIKLNKHIKIFL
jgi:peptidoglycan/LPS O-acetylase OafA/YrhL